MNPKISQRWRLAAAGIATALTLTGVAACSQGQDSATTASSTSSSSATPSSSKTSASSANTKLSAKTVTVTIGGQQMTLSGAYVVDGVDVTIDGGTYASMKADQVVFLVVNGGHLTITNATIEKSGTPADAASDNYNFYGSNSAVLVVGEGSSVTMSNSTVNTTSAGSNAIFATASAKANVSGVKISTTADSSRGLDATYAATITAKNVDIHTLGAHCAAVATDRGNGTVTVTGTNKMVTEGEGSPLIYSTGKISVSGVTGSSKASEAVVVEGKNSASLTGSTITSGGTNAVMLYQSFSGDAADPDSTSTSSSFAVSDTTLTHTGSGAVIYATNTTTTATLTNVTVKTSGATAVQAKADRWGTSGSNGGKLTLTLNNTKLSGALADGSSTITVTTASGGALDGSKSGSVTLS